MDNNIIDPFRLVFDAILFIFYVYTKRKRN